MTYVHSEGIFNIRFGTRQTNCQIMFGQTVTQIKNSQWKKL